MQRERRAQRYEMLSAVLGAVLLVVMLVKTGMIMELIKSATSANKEKVDEGEKQLGNLKDVINNVSNAVMVAGFLLIPVGAAGAGIAWLLGSPKGPRYLVSVVGAGLLIGSAGIIVA